MIGPMAMNGDAFQDPFPAGADRETILMWQERQRRQRSVRMLMMMLMFLLLLDGEEPPAARQRRQAHLRRSGSRGGASHHGKRRNGSGAVLDRAVFDARTRQDEKIRRAAMLHGRFQELVELNEGRDVELEVRQWADAEAAKAAAAAAAAAEEEAMEKEDEENNNSRFGRKKKVKTKAKEKEAKADFEEDEKDGDKDKEQKIYHYPTNVTGYYRGGWKRVHVDADTQLDSDEDKSGKSSTTTTSSTAIDRRRLLKEARKKKKKTESPSAVADIDKTANADKDAANATSKIVNETEIEAIMKERMRDHGDRVGLFLLPRGMLLDEGDNTTLSPSDKDYRDTQIYLRGQKQQRKSSKRADNDKRDDNDSPPKLSLTKEEGKAAFQLYTRPIPTMSQVSLVEGFVKLYGETSSAFSSRQDLLMRVRGIVVHPLGKISLVANSGKGRSAMIIRAEEDTSMSSKKVIGEEETNVAKVDEEDREEHQRRQLREQVAGLVGTHKESQNVDAVERIRDDILSLFPEDSSSLGAAEPFLFDDNSEWSQDNDEHDIFEFGNGEKVFQSPNYEEFHRQEQITAVSSWFSINEGTSYDDGILLPWLIGSARQLLGIVGRQENDSLHDGITSGRRLSESINLDPTNHTKSSERTKISNDLNARESVADLEINSTDVNISARSERELKKSKTTKSTKEVVVGNKTKVESGVGDRNYTEALGRMTKDIQTFPFVPDDNDHTVENAVTPIDRRIPYREKLLEENGIQCEFQLSFDIGHIQWTLDEWKELAQQQRRDRNDLDPYLHDGDADSAEGDDASTKRTAKKTRELRRTFTTSSAHSRKRSSKKEALAMMLTGSIISTDCDFHSTINVTAIRTNWEKTTGKAINYSFYMMLTCLTQIVVLLRQLLHTQAQSSAVRVSLIGLGWQTVLDAIICVSHIFLCLIMSPLFTAFASVAFFKLLIFCVIEMKYMAIILQARHTANGNGGTSAEELRRRVALLHIRFYSALMFAICLFYYAGEKHRIIYVLALYSFWIPQIICNVVHQQPRAAIHRHYVYGMSATRLIAPLYVFGLSNNFLKDVDPDHPTNVLLCDLLVLWVGFQTAILIGQEKYGARFFIPKIFLPPKYDYCRPIPPSLLSQADEIKGNEKAPSSEDKAAKVGLDKKESGLADKIESSDRSHLSPLHLSTAATEDAPLEKSTGMARRGKRSRSRIGSKAKAKQTTMQEEPSDVCCNDGKPSLTLDCVICYNDIDVTKKTGYMIAPCDHIFHKDCLMQWMDVKMLCPICRKELPAL